MKQILTIVTIFILAFLLFNYGSPNVALGQGASIWYPNSSNQATLVDDTWGLKVTSLVSCTSIATDGNGVFSCGAPGGGGGGGFPLYVQNGGATLNTGTTTLNFTSNSFALTENPTDTFTIRVSTTTLGLLASSISDFVSTVRTSISETITGIGYDSGTGIFSLDSGYTIPTTTRANNWDTAFGWGNHASQGYITDGNTLWDNSYGFVTSGQTVGTSTAGVAGEMPYWTGIRTLGSIATGTLTETTTGLELSATRSLIGGSSILSLTSGYFIPTTTRAANWDTAFSWGNHASQGYITDGNTNWDNSYGFITGNGTTTLTGDVSGSGTTTISVTVTDDSHNHTGTTISGLDISSDTNLTVSATGLELSADAIALTSGYVIPTTTRAINWDTAFSWGNHASAGYDQVTTAGDGLTRTVNDFDCDTGSGTVFGCITAADWTTFNNKVSSTSIDTSNELLTLLTDETGSGSAVFSASPTFTGTAIFANYTATNGTTTNASTTNLYIGSTLSGAGLVTCSDGVTSKLLYNATTRQFSCGTDQSGGGGGGGGGWATTTDANNEAGEIVTYNSTDVYIGGSASNTAEFNFDKDAARFTIASTTAVATGSIYSQASALRFGSSTGESAIFDFNLSNTLRLFTETGISLFDLGSIGLNTTNATATTFAATTICLSGDCKTAWPTGGGGGSISTSSIPVTGNLAYWSSPSTLTDVATGTLSESITGIDLSASRYLVGGAAALSLTAGYEIPTTTRMATWDTAYGWGNHASQGYLTTVDISANTNLTVTATGLELSSDALALTAGYTIPTTTRANTWDTAFGWGNHASQGYLTTVDISANTNLSADGTEIVLTGDALSLGSNLTFTSATATNVDITGSITLFGGGAKSTNNALCIQLTGSAGLCDGDDGGGGGSSKWTDGINFSYLTNTAYDLVFGSNATETAPFWWDVSATTSYIGNGGAGDSVITFGPSATTSWTIGFDDTDDSFSIASSTALGSFYFMNMTSTSSVLRKASTLATLLPDNGMRIGLGSNTYFGGGLLDQLAINGRVRNQSWNNIYCPVLVGNTAITSDTSTAAGITLCNGMEFYEDGSETFTNVVGDGFQYQQMGGTAANGGAGVFVRAQSNGWLKFATSTPSMEVTARIGTIASFSSTTNYYIGYSNIAAGGTTYENVPTIGCYFVASTTQANWMARCTTSSSAATLVDTGIASTSLPLGAGKWSRFRVDADADKATFYIKYGDTNMVKVAEISTNVPTTTAMNAGVWWGRTTGAQAIQFDLMDMDFWWRRIIPNG